MKDFTNHCYAKINDTVNSECGKFKIKENNGNNSLVAIGENLLPNATYFYELIYNIHMNKPGNLTFKYKKDTINQDNNKNGQFNFYVDFDLKLHDENEEKDYKNFTVSLNNGKHSLMWQYFVSSNINTTDKNTLNFELIDIEIDNYHHDDTKCIPCDESSKDLDVCNVITCPEGEFYGSLIKKCTKCQDDEYHLENPIDTTDCVKKPTCNQDFIIEEHLGNCDVNGVEDIIYKFDESLICNKKSKQFRTLQKIPAVPAPSADLPPKPTPPAPSADLPPKPAPPAPSADLPPGNIKIKPENPEKSAEILKNNPKSQANKNKLETKPIFQLNDTVSTYFIKNSTPPENKKEKCKACSEGYFIMPNSTNKICESCLPNSIFDTVANKCVLCQDGSQPIKLLSITGHTKQVSKLFDSNVCSLFKGDKFKISKGCPGWIFRSHGIHSGVVVPQKVEKVLKKSVNIIEEIGAFISVNFTITRLDETLIEEFSIYINGEEVESFKSHRHDFHIDYFKFYPLAKGSNGIEFIYKKEESNNTQIENANIFSVIITEIKIQGSDQGAGKKCFECPEDSYKVNNQGQLSCVKCKKGTLPDQDKCVPCPSSSTNSNCLQCPEFTNVDNSECILYGVIHIKNVFLKYDIFDLSSSVQHECKDHNEICYNTFIGPIRDNIYKDMFFISFNKSDLIKISDFNYKQSPLGFNSKGHIFALFSSGSDEDYGPTKKNKILSNIGASISDVKVFYIPNKEFDKLVSPSTESKNIFDKNGVMIKYSNGDYCNDKKRYQSYLFVKCQNSDENYAPKLVKKSKDGCVFYFEWLSKAGCPVCTIQETSNYRKVNIFLNFLDKL